MRFIKPPIETVRMGSGHVEKSWPINLDLCLFIKKSHVTHYPQIVFYTIKFEFEEKTLEWFFVSECDRDQTFSDLCDIMERVSDENLCPKGLHS